jgi:hypothetical protein
MCHKVKELAMIRLILFAYLALIAVLLVSTELSKNDYFGESDRLRLALHHNDLAEHQAPPIFRHHG